MIKATLFAIFILFSYATLESNAASCPNIPVISNFDASRYIGTWYEIQRFNYIFELGLKCVSATYGSINSTMISVYNKGTTIFNTVSTVSGYAYAPDSSAPNKLVVNLPVQIGSLTLFRNNGDYQVVDTDYTNYALVYSCKLTLGFIKSEVVWILSRQKTLSDATITNLKTKLTNLGISTKSFVSVDQSC